jgi:hypothetical protein
MTGSTDEGLPGGPRAGIRQRCIGRSHRVPHGALVRLERSAAKVARCVLRGLGEGDLAWLPGAAVAFNTNLTSQAT